MYIDFNSPTFLGVHSNETFRSEFGSNAKISKQEIEQLSKQNHSFGAFIQSTYFERIPSMIGKFHDKGFEIVPGHFGNIL